MPQLKPNMLNTIYVISNMHLNYNLGIHPSGYSSLQKVSPLCESNLSSIDFDHMFFLFLFFLIW
jgi:hypothetical protein